MIKGIAFDMDGLMFDTERLAVEGWVFAGKQMGLYITEDIVIKTLGLDITNTKRVLFSNLGEAFDFSAARKIRVDYVTSYIESNGIPIKIGLIELLDYLYSNHYRITVATSSEKERAQYYLQSRYETRYDT